MKRLSAMAIAAIAGTASAADFAAPVRVLGGDTPIKVESPGYACPCLADIDRDGIPDLLVGQFNGGKIRFYKGIGPGKYAAATWLQAEGATAEIPGVW
jgi:hypothetical protein